MVRELAGYDYDRAQQILQWPVREALLAFEARLRQQSLDSYRHELLVWAIMAPHAKKVPDAPTLPSILN